MRNLRNRKGFTLVELLVVVLILAILMAVALPLYLNSVKDSSKKTCRANMQSIANAAQAWKVAGRYTDFSGLTDLNQLSGDLGSTPKCPDGGTYSIVAGSGTVKGVNGNGDSDTGTVPATGIGVQCSLTNTHGGFIAGTTSN